MPQQGSKHQPGVACVVARVARPGEQNRPIVGFLSPSRPQHAHRHTPIRTLVEMEKVCAALRCWGLRGRPRAAVQEQSGSARQQGRRSRPVGNKEDRRATRQPAIDDQPGAAGEEDHRARPQHSEAQQGAADEEHHDACQPSSGARQAAASEEHRNETLQQGGECSPNSACVVARVA